MSYFVLLLRCEYKYSRTTKESASSFSLHSLYIVIFMKTPMLRRHLFRQLYSVNRLVTLQSSVVLKASTFSTNNKYKTEVVLLIGGRKIKGISIRMGYNVVDTQESLRYPGVHFDRNMRTDSHVRLTAGRVLKLLQA